MKTFIAGLAGATLCMVASAGPMVIHEWGTFTVLQDESGRAISGINIDDEPLPRFVHRIGSPIRQALQARGVSKGIARAHSNVTMRLETPVVYFYPDGSEPVKVDLRVVLRGGWLTEFYPLADVEAPGAPVGRLECGTTGVLEWKNLRVGGRAEGPKTDARVWTAPREVEAASVATGKGETERYLFYRGVANLEAPLRVVREGTVLRVERGSLLAEEAAPDVGWLAEFRDGGRVAFRRVPLHATEAGGSEIGRVAAHFTREDFTEGSKGRLREALRAALVKGGLFPKEAEAMLNTWDHAYFETRGLRFFHLVPPDWTNRRLPMQVSVEAELTRVMIGRVEIITPEQREALAVLADQATVFVPCDPPGAYYRLGRFADAIIGDAIVRSRSEKLRNFCALYGIDQPSVGEPVARRSGE
jgi:hypothetical protein